jgi:predicted transcriptional regulator
MLHGPLTETAGPVELDRSESRRLMEVLDDRRTDALLEALASADGRLTVNELSDGSDIPLSTVYRKIDGLEDVGVVDGRTELRHDGKHTSSYGLVVDRVELDLTPEGLSATVYPSEDDEERPTSDRTRVEVGH